MRHLRATIVLGTVILIGSIPAHAQAIDTNRPGFSFTTGVVAPGQWQLETGIGYTRNSDGSNTLTLPQAEFRYGVGSDVEVFVSSIDWLDNSRGNSGLTDPTVGAKVAFGDPGAALDMALLFEVSVPIGDSDLSNDRWNPSLGFIWSYSGGLPLAGTAKLSKFGSDYQFDNGLKLPFEIREGQSAFVEWEANFPESGGSSHWLNGGYQLLREQRLQFDASAGIGLNDRAGDYRFGVGLSYRF